MRRLGWVVSVVGVLLVALGVTGAVVLGPDSRFTTGPHAVETASTVVVTTPGVITHRGLQVDVLAEVPVDKPVFVGLGNSVDVQDYVAEAERLEVTAFGTPWQPETREVEGRPGLPGAPTALDWWIADSAGLGGTSISTTLPDETVSMAIVAVGATNLSGLEVTLAYGLKGGFAASVGLVLLGGGGLLGGHALRRGERWWVESEQTDELEVVEEVVYVYVDEDGVEHEISAEEAAALEGAGPDDPEPGIGAGPVGLADVVEVAPRAEDRTEDETATAQADESADERGLAPPRSIPTAGVRTAADFAEQPSPAEDPVPAVETEPVSAGGAEAAAEGPEPVVYVFVDEDGVEHEVSEDELDRYEVVDEDES